MSEDFYPDSNNYLDQENTPKEETISEDQKTDMGINFEWPVNEPLVSEKDNILPTLLEQRERLLPTYE